jgi:Zn-finger nucleic acid-binding protein
MECPKCDARLAPVQVDEIQVDRCVRCGGIWFDGGEHEAVRQVPGAAPAIDTGPAWQASMHNRQERSYCPRDGTLMIRVAVPDEPTILVERCPRCDGSFFDAGEFSELKDRALSEMVRRSRPMRRID